MQNWKFIPLSAAGVPRDSCSTLSFIKRKPRANPCATTWLGKKVQNPSPSPLLVRGCMGFAFIPKIHYISAEFFVSPFCVFTAKAVFTSQLSTSGIRFQFIKKKKKIHNPQSG